MLPRSTEIRPQVAADSSPLPSPSPHYLPARGGSSAYLRGLGILELPVSVYGGVPCPYIRGERLGASEHASGGGRAAPLPASLSLPCLESARRRPREPQAWPVPVPRRCAAAFPTLPLLLKRVVSARAPGPAQVQARARAQARGCARALARISFEIFVLSATLRPDAFAKVACTSLFLHFVATTPSFGSSKT